MPVLLQRRMTLGFSCCQSRCCGRSQAAALRLPQRSAEDFVLVRLACLSRVQDALRHLPCAERSQKCAIHGTTWRCSSKLSGKPRQVRSFAALYRTFAVSTWPTVPTGLNGITVEVKRLPRLPQTLGPRRAARHRLQDTL